MSDHYPYYGVILPMSIGNLSELSTLRSNSVISPPQVVSMQIHMATIGFVLCGIALLLCTIVIGKLYFSLNNLKKNAKSNEKIAAPELEVTSGFNFLIVWVDEMGRLRYMDKETAHQVGLSHNYLHKHAIWDITNNITSNTWQETWNLLKLKKHIRFEEKMTIPETQQEVIYEQTYHFVQFKGIEVVISYWQNITERKMEERALIESEERYKTLVDQSPIPIALINSERKLKYLNYTAIKMFGLHNKLKVTGHDIMEIIHPESKALVLENLLKLRSGIGHEPMEIKLQRADGKVLHTMTSSLPVTFSGEPVVLVVCNDITEYKKVLDALNENEIMLKQQNEEYITVNEQLLRSNQRIQQINLELMKAKDKAEKSDRLKTAFLANLSHEIRTPMNGILGFSELLLQPNLNQHKQESYIQLITQNSHKLLSIINDIVDISKIESGQINITPILTNLNTIVNNIKLQMEGQMKEKNIEFLAQVGLTDANADVYTDDTHLRQVLLNLLSNALKFTPKGSIKFGYKIKDAQIEFFVSDTGIGIATENHKVIFENFRQIEPEDRSVVSGTGLGLSISKAFVELLGGKIWLTSEIGQGSVFNFTIPYRPVTLLIDSATQTTQTGKYNWTQKTILVADDDDNSFINIEEILSVTYVQILRAANGADAIEICKNHPNIDLIILNLDLPLVNGFVATRMIKHMRPNIPIIAQTTYNTTDDRTKALNAGCNDYIFKPIDKTELLKKIETQFNKNSVSA